MLRSLCTAPVQWVLASLVLLTGAPVVHAQSDYPNKPIKIIIPSAPATGFDILARTLGQKLSEDWKVPVIPDNRPGASGNIGIDAVAKSAPDGYTLLVTANIIVQNHSLSKTSFDPIKDFVPVAPLAIGVMALVTNPSVKASNVKEWVERMKESPGQYNYASPGNGTPHHFAMELLKLQTGAPLTHIPYKSTGSILPDLISGRIATMFLPLHVALPLAKDGKIILLSAGGNHRALATPDIPSMAEATGIQDFDADIWFAMYAPAGTPADITAKLNKQVNVLLKRADVKEALMRAGLNVTGGTQQELAELTRKDLVRWMSVAEQAKIKAD